jgi:hypothetical protein
VTIDVRAKEIDWIGTLERAIATALQAGLAVWTVGGLDSGKAAVTAAAAAGLSVLKNVVKDWVSKVEKA